MKNRTYIALFVIAILFASCAKKERFMLEGGGMQIVLDPADLNRSKVTKREATPWGYDSGLIGDGKTSMVGVPRLKQNWYGDKK